LNGRFASLGVITVRKTAAGEKLEGGREGVNLQDWEKKTGGSASVKRGKKKKKKKGKTRARTEHRDSWKGGYYLGGKRTANWRVKARTDLRR